ncbi:unnamed protein product, partial [Discosporangium mesarthrocarpum]
KQAGRGACKTDFESLIHQCRKRKWHRQVLTVLRSMTSLADHGTLIFTPTPGKGQSAGTGTGAGTNAAGAWRAQADPNEVQPSPLQAYPDPSPNPDTGEDMVGLATDLQGGGKRSPSSRRHLSWHTLQRIAATVPPTSSLAPPPSISLGYQREDLRPDRATLHSAMEALLDMGRPKEAWELGKESMGMEGGRASVPPTQETAWLLAAGFLQNACEDLALRLYWRLNPPTPTTPPKLGFSPPWEGVVSHGLPPTRFLEGMMRGLGRRPEEGLAILRHVLLDRHSRTSRAG